MEWLRGYIKDCRVEDGEVDESILKDVFPKTLTARFDITTWITILIAFLSGSLFGATISKLAPFYK